jgi:large subunit ribosomal protein L10
LDREEKELFVKTMSERLQKAKATFLVDYKGLDVEAMNSLRGKLRGVDTELQVVKNRLLKLACRETESAPLNEHMVGPCALVISYEDAVAPAKVLVEQGKASGHLTVKAGQISGRVIESDGIKRLADLPSREVLLGQALSAMQAVPSSLARLLNNIAVGLLNVLKAIETQKGEGESPGE